LAGVHRTILFIERDAVNDTDLCFTPATDLRRLLQSHDLSPVELAKIVLERIEKANPVIHAFLTVSADFALVQAKAAEDRLMRNAPLSPLDGIPYSIKDLEPTAGIRTTFGSKWFENNVPSEDGAVAGRLRQAGGILLGKTNTPHFGYKDMCDNLLGPPCRNPWKLDRTSGASSGGAGAAVAAGLGPVAQGSDGGGSIRIPAAHCGIFGLKPSFGRVPYHPNPDYWAARSHMGPMTRTVRDAAMLLNVMAGPDARDPLSISEQPDDYVRACDGGVTSFRIGWSPDLGHAAVDPEIRSISERAAQRFADLGCTVDAPVLNWPDPTEFHRTIYEVGIASRLADRARERPDWIEPTLMQIILRGSATSAVDHGKALLARGALYHAVQRFFESYDLLVTPTMPVAAWSAEPGPDEGPREIGGRPTPTMFDRIPFTYPFNLTGHPAASVPCGFTNDGVPVGLQIVGRHHADSTVLRAAAAFESIQPWAQYRPSFPN
jgi:Asp-tRNA(Asn)/Glu-tRNA(Gln) amidotransferase A subunit family amidase